MSILRSTPSLKRMAILIAPLFLVACHSSGTDQASSGSTTPPGPQASGGPAGPMTGPAAPSPQPGEIMLSGTVTSEPAGGKFTMKVVSVQGAGLPPKNLPAPRGKTVTSNPTTKYTSGGAPATMADLKPGAPIVVIGPDTGKGAKIPARVVEITTGGAPAPMAGGPPSGNPPGPGGPPAGGPPTGTPPPGGPAPPRPAAGG